MLNSDKHLSIIDNYAGNFKLLSEYQKTYKEAQQINNEINRINIDNEEKERRISLLTYEAETIYNANLRKGEYEELLEKRKLISNSQKIIDNINDAYSKLSDGYNGFSATELVSDALKKVNSVASFDSEIDEISSRLSDAYYNLCDVASNLGNYLSAFSFNEDEIDEIERRIDELNSIKRRFGADYDTVMEYYEKITRELDEINKTEENIEKLNKELNEKKKVLKDLSDKLTKTRKEASKQLEEEIVCHLAELNMKNTVFKVVIKTVLIK